MILMVLGRKQTILHKKWLKVTWDSRCLLTYFEKIEQKNNFKISFEKSGNKKMMLIHVLDWPSRSPDAMKIP